MATFDLIDEPWIPCTMLDRSRSRRPLGLREVLAQAQDIRELGGDSPLEVAALHRLLLAVLHRNFDIGNEQQWGALWENGAFDSGVIDCYFERWRHRFNLFDEDRPFYQVASLDPTKGVSSARLFFEPDNGATLFTHVSTSDPPSLTPDVSARQLVGYMAFDFGGRKSDPPGVSANAAPLNNSAVILAKGETLFRTLMLNLCRYAPEDEEPWPFNRDEDVPAWERDEETRPEDRRPAGYIDLLTWQSRRIRLQPETGQDGGTVVKNVVIMKGSQFPNSFELRHTETMLAFSSNPRARGTQDPWPVVRLTEDRALWRDSHALMSSVQAESTQPKTLKWLADLANGGIIPYSQVIPVDAIGLRNTQAKVHFWRHERLPLPLAYLKDKQLADTLREVLELTETTAQGLDRAMWTMARRMLAADPDRKLKAEDIRSLSDHLGAARAYWSRLEAPFKQLLVELPDDKDDEGEYGGVQFGKWKSTLRDALWEAFRESTRGMERSTRNLKAVALAERSLTAITRRYLAAQEAGDLNDAAKND